MEPKAITAKAVQDTVVAALRILSVLVGGLTVLFGLVAKRDLAGLIAWAQSDGFVVFAGAVLSAGSLIWGLWKTYSRSHESNTLKTIINDPSLPPSPPASVDKLVALIPVLLVFGMLTGCATLGSVRLNADKAFYTAQIAVKSAQQSTLAVCATPAPRLLVPCRTAVGLLAKAADAEAAGFAAQQAGHASDLQAAVAAMMDVPPALAALGILEAK